MGRPKKKASEPDEVLTGPESVLEIINDLENEKSGLKPVSLIAGRGILDSISTGCLTADLILGGGFPPGRIVEVYGPSGSGKSTLMYEMCAALHRLKVPTCFFDHEAGSEPSYMQRIGMKLDDKSGLTRYYQPDHGDQTYKRILSILKRLPEKNSGPPQVAFIIDSIPAMPSKLEIEDPDKNPIGLRGRMHSEWLGKITTHLGKKRCTLIAVNQIRMTIASFPGANPEDTPGGQAWKFYPSVKMRVSRVGKLIEVGSEKFQEMKLVTKKNRHFSPFQEAIVHLHLGHGIADESDVSVFLKKTGFMKPQGIPNIIGLDDFAPKGTKFKFKSNDEFTEYVKNDDSIRRACEAAIKAGEAQIRYLGVQQGYSVEELAKGEHLSDPNISVMLNDKMSKKAKLLAGKTKKGKKTKAEPKAGKKGKKGKR